MVHYIRAHRHLKHCMYNMVVIIGWGKIALRAHIPPMELCHVKIAASAIIAPAP